MNKPTRKHAIVIGASMAGLAAARVLSEDFDRVTVIDRDELPGQPAHRKGVPQSQHLHILLAKGAGILESWFPGLGDELLAAGAVTIDWPAETLWQMAAGWSGRFSYGLEMISCSRHLLEWTVRQRVGALPNVSLMTGRDVVGLVGDPAHDRVTGLQHRKRGPEGLAGDSASTTADLIVDASGRNSQAPAWLAELGYPQPRETTITSFLGYASRTYAPPQGFNADWKAIYLQAQPPENARMGGLFTMENGTWIVSLGGAGRDYPPTDEAGFLDFALSLRSSAIYDAIRRAEPLSPIRGYQRTANQFRRYDRLKRFPDGLLILGDALCAFNPIYGQGMTVAAMQARALDACLREQARRHPAGDLSGMARRFHKAAARCAADAWMISTGEDLRYPTTEGARAGFQERLTHRYLDRVNAAATRDQSVNRAFVEVLNLMRPPTSLFRPSVLLPTLLGPGRHPQPVEPTSPATREVPSGG